MYQDYQGVSPDERKLLCQLFQDNLKVDRDTAGNELHKSAYHRSPKASPFSIKTGLMPLAEVHEIASQCVLT